MIRKKNLFITGITLLLIAFILNLPFPNSTPLGHFFFSFLNLPIYGDEGAMTGIHYVGVTCMILILTALFFINNSLNRHHVKFTMLAALIGIAGPAFTVEAMQKTVLPGIYAVSYHAENSSCTFERNKKEAVLTGTCKLSFENHRSKPVTFEVALDERFPFEDEQPLLHIMNKPKTHTITLESKGYQTVEITSSVKVADLSTEIYSGEMNGFHVNIYQKGIKRYL